MDRLMIAQYKEKEGNKVLTVYNDDIPINPLNDWDHGGHLWVCSKYALGEKDFTYPETLQKAVADEYPVFVFDFQHRDFGSGGSRLYLNGPYTLSPFLRPDLVDTNDNEWEDPFIRCDMGVLAWEWNGDDQDGYYFITEKDMVDGFGENWRNIEGIEETIKKNVESVMKVYEKYINGDVLMFEVTEECTCSTCEVIHEKDLDSCGGVYNLEDIWDCAEEKREDWEEVYHI